VCWWLVLFSELVFPKRFRRLMGVPLLVSSAKDGDRDLPFYVPFKCRNTAFIDFHGHLTTSLLPWSVCAYKNFS
jgi:hypothetical protein